MTAFRSTLRAEESLFSLKFKPREIPHFVRDDNQGHASRKLLRTHWREAPIQLRSRDSISFIVTLSDAGVRPKPTPNSTFRNLLVWSTTPYIWCDCSLAGLNW